jgi:hypothetical protein
MPSLLHESHLLLFRNQPTLAAELIRDVLHVEVPRYKEARVDSADLTDIQPAEYRADLVIQMIEDVPVLGIIVEVQLSPYEPKKFAWPAYAANLRARARLPTRNSLSCLRWHTDKELTRRSPHASPWWQKGRAWLWTQTGRSYILISS